MRQFDFPESDKQEVSHNGRRAETERKRAIERERMDSKIEREV